MKCICGNCKYYRGVDGDGFCSLDGVIPYHECEACTAYSEEEKAMKVNNNDKNLANVYYWLGYIMSDVEQIDGYDDLRNKIYYLKDALDDLVCGEEK